MGAVVSIATHRKCKKHDKQPSSQDDARQGWKRGDKYTYLVIGITEVYLCLSNTPAQAVWELLS